MGKNRPAITLLICALLVSTLTGCGVLYGVGSHVKVSRMRDSLRPGLSTVDVAARWGDPDLVTNEGPTSQVWSYADQPNRDDPVAYVFYTSTREGDSGRFLDLKFVDGRLVSWQEAEHTMPSKEWPGFTIGIGGPVKPNYGFAPPEFNTPGSNPEVYNY